MHWADVEAEALLANGPKHLISTGITPSGTLHVGTLREAITAEAVRKALASKKADVKMIYLVDSWDPLRKRYPFLPESFEAHVGKPLSDIPCPCGQHANYAQHYIQPFLDSIVELGIHCDVLWTHEQYALGRFADVIDQAIAAKDTVAQVLKEVSGRDVPADFFPYSPKCQSCGRLDRAKVTGYEKPYVSYRCACGHEGRADIRKGDGKMPWRVEWAAKWKVFGVTCEPFGKDHAAAGGSFDTGVRLAQEVFGIKPPHPVPYEFVQLKGKGQMHKSTGSSVTGVDALRVTPPQVMNYIILRVNPGRHIDYDAGLGILDMVDEYDRVEAQRYSGQGEADLSRAYDLSQPNGPAPSLPWQVPYRHLVTLVQSAGGFDGVVAGLKRMGKADSLDADAAGALRQRVACVQYWLDHFAPDEVRFKVCPELPQVELSQPEKEFLAQLAAALEAQEWDGEKLQDAIYEMAKASPAGAKGGFRALYRIFLDRDKGPRLGFFLSTLDKSFVLDRVRQGSA